jgi:hypothetical protein
MSWANEATTPDWMKPDVPEVNAVIFNDFVGTNKYVVIYGNVVHADEEGNISMLTCDEGRVNLRVSPSTYRVSVVSVK